MRDRVETKVKVAVACGGTGGHIFPGLATAEALRAAGHDVTLWLAGRDVEAMSVVDWPGAVHRVHAIGFPSGFSVRSVRTALNLVKAVWTCRRLMKRDRPDVCLAMGSYASVGPVLAARLTGVPVVLHEANVVPGRAISFLSRWASVVALGFDAARSHFPSCRVETTGLPLRARVLDGVEGAGVSWFPDWNKECLTVLVVGGSQGAHALNETVSEAITQVDTPDDRVQVIHLTGRVDEDRVRKRYEASGVVHSVHGFLEDMPGAYRLTSIAICRSGAATCAELSVYGVPAVFVPLPSARRDHQHANAEEVCRQGDSELLPENEMTVDRVVELLRQRVASGSASDRALREIEPSLHHVAADRLAELVVRTAAQS